MIVILILAVVVLGLWNYYLYVRLAGLTKLQSAMLDLVNAIGAQVDEYERKQGVINKSALDTIQIHNEMFKLFNDRLLEVSNSIASVAQTVTDLIGVVKKMNQGDGQEVDKNTMN